MVKQTKIYLYLLVCLLGALIALFVGKNYYAAAFASLPVSVAKNSFDLTLAQDLRKRYNIDESLKGGDVALYFMLHVNELLPSALSKRAHQVNILDSNLQTKISQLRTKTSLGEMSLQEWLEDPRTRTQAVMVVHRGQVIFEAYPGMQEIDNHLWMSAAKPVVGLLINILEAEHKIEIQTTVGEYLPEFANSTWSKVKVIDLLNMTTGLNIEENYKNYLNKDSYMRRFVNAEFGESDKSMQDILLAAEYQQEPGSEYAYSSATTQMLVLIIEKVTQLSFAEVLQQRIWSKIGAEGDLVLGLTPQGTAIAHGILATRLSDFARFGMLFTPSSARINAQDILPKNYFVDLQSGCKSELYTGAVTERMSNDLNGEQPICNSYQWDAILSDGDLYKPGLLGQGLYVSPNKDLVVAWFGCGFERGIGAFARKIAISLDP